MLNQSFMFSSYKYTSDNHCVQLRKAGNAGRGLSEDRWPIIRRVQLGEGRQPLKHQPLGLLQAQL